MKRILLLAGVMALVLVSLSLAAYRPETPPAVGVGSSAPLPVPGGEAPPAPAPPAQNWGLQNSTRPPVPATPVAPAKPPSIVDELVAILNETKSKETFSVTLTVLQKFGKEAKPAVPAILRNADRLGLFAGALAGDSKGKQASTDVLEAIDAILGKESAKSETVVPVPVLGDAKPPSE